MPRYAPLKSANRSRGHNFAYGSCAEPLLAWGRKSGMAFGACAKPYKPPFVVPLTSPRQPGNRAMRTRLAMRWIMAAFYCVAGVLHLTAADGFLAIVPGWVPFPREVVLLTGLCEIAGACALLTARWRRLAGMMLALYAVCVFPANIKHAFEGVSVVGRPPTDTPSNACLMLAGNTHTA